MSDRVAKYTARRTLVFEQNTWEQVSPFLEDESIKGLVFLHRRDAPDERAIDHALLSELVTRASVVRETDELVVYRLK